MKETTLSLIALGCCILSTMVNAATPPGTAFTYQGRLNDGGNPANGSYVFRFSLDDGNGVFTVGSPVVTPPVNVSNRLFTVTLDFGPGIFTNANRRLNIEVRTNLSNLNFTALTPPQPILPTPYAIYAEGVDATGISGVVPSAFSAVTATNFSGPLLGDVSGTQGATVVSTVGGQSATKVANGVSAANAATDANVPNAIVKRDGNGALSAASVTLSGALYLPFPAIVYSGTNTLMIEKGSTFYGSGAGRGETGFGENVGVGDNVLSSGTVGGYNTGIGERALEHNTAGEQNTASGYEALNRNSIGGGNTASGYHSLYHNTFGAGNTADGTDALYSNMGGNDNTAVGGAALYSNVSGTANTAVGVFALQNNTTADDNTALGDSALYSNTTGIDNTAAGAGALLNNSTGNGNTAMGSEALRLNMIGKWNTAVGQAALYNNTADGNTANGRQALYSNTTGDHNMASGMFALKDNTTGNYNTADGAFALESNVTGGGNTAGGFGALVSNTNGNNNTASGYFALNSNTSGDNNTAIGLQALFANKVGYDNVAIGSGALYNQTNGFNNVALGTDAGSSLTSGRDNIDIGNPGVGSENFTIRIGTQGTHTRTFIGGISGVTVAGGDAVRVTSSGQLGIVTSSARFKRDIRSMADASDVLLSLRPVTFRYKPELDPEAMPQFGLVAEEVEKVDPDLVARDDKNQVYTVRYEAVNAMLLNEFLKQHRKVEQQKNEIQTLKDQNGSLEKRLNELEQTVQALAERK